jgi:hypothetical protein
MPAEKFSASMEDALLADARADAEAEGLTFSGWLADAAADRLRLKELRKLVSDWEVGVSLGSPRTSMERSKMTPRTAADAL